ncbi:MAG: hypothetical protein RH942_15160 [Kiloniellaceae bacterium]
MPTTKTIAVERGSKATVTAPTTKTLASQSARLLGWKTELVRSLGRELHALHNQQQERAFMATGHGLNYGTAAGQTAAPH